MRSRKVLARSVRSAVEMLESRLLLSSTYVGTTGTASLSGVVFNDVNNDGVQDAGETAIAGATVTVAQVGVVYPAGTTPTVQADANGGFSFSGLAPGQYDVTLVPQTGLVQDWPGTLVETLNAGIPVALNLGETSATVASATGITGVVYNDLNGNGVQDTGEPTIAGASVTITEIGNYSTQTVQTDSTGTFSFPGLIAGQYQVNVVPLTGYVQDAPGKFVVSVTSGQTVSAINLGETNNAASGGSGNATISGTLFNDIFQSGIYQQGTEDFLSGDTVYLDLNGSGALTPNDPTTLTGNIGQYSFNVPPGSYEVRVVPRPNFFQDPPGYSRVTVYSDQTIVQDIGETDNAVISGTVFVDNNGNGLQDTGDLPIAGETVVVEQTANGVIEPGAYDATDGQYDGNLPTSTTNASGGYSLTGLQPGSYRVLVVSNSGLVEDAPGYFDVTVTAGQDAVENIGEGQPSNFSGTVYDDHDGSGSRKPGDQGLANQQVFLDLNNNGIYDAQGTGSDALPLDYAQVTYTTDPNVTVYLDGAPSSLAALFPGDIASMTMITGTNTPVIIQASDQVKTGVQGDPFPAPAVAGTVLETTGNTITLITGEPTAITDNNGNFTIANLGPGTYTARVIVPQGAIATGPASATHSITFTVGSGGNITGQNFGFETPDLTDDVVSYPTAPTLTGVKKKAVVRITNVGSLPDIGLAGVTLWAQTTDLPVDVSTAFLVGSLPGRPIKLKVGQSKTFNVVFSYPTQLQSNSYYVSAQVVSTVHDNNSANDFSPVIGPLQIAPPFVDMSLAYASNPALIVDPGSPTTISLAVTNLGNVTSIGLISFRVYITTTPTVEPTDIVEQVNNFKGVHIKPGRTKIFDLTMPNPGQNLGFRYIDVDLDSGDPLGDTNLLNNIVIEPYETRFD